METIYKSAWICIRDRKMLFARSKGKDIFYLPGGKREAGETDEEALVREIAEEVGAELTANSLTVYKRFRTPAHGRPDTEVEVTAFFGVHTGDIAPATEIEEVAWFSSADHDRVPLAGQRLLRWLKADNYID